MAIGKANAASWALGPKATVGLSGRDEQPLEFPLRQPVEAARGLNEALAIEHAHETAAVLDDLLPLEVLELYAAD